MTLREFIQLCMERLSPLYPEVEARAIGFRLLEHYCDIPPYKYISEPDLVISDSGSSRHAGLDPAPGTPLSAALDDLAIGRPLQYVLGFTAFFGHRFKVGEGCLIPRPETEDLVSRIVDDLYGDAGEAVPDDDSAGGEGDWGPFNILDLCTGSGCIAWSLAAEFPEAMVYGCDISDAALRYACRQRIKVGGAKPIFFQADILQAPPAGLPKFDVIVANPPYICERERESMRRNVLDFEPAEALFVPDDDPLRFYRAVARWAAVLLRPAAPSPGAAGSCASSGRIYLEINERFGPAVASLFPGSSIVRDINGKDRFVIR